MTGKNVKVQFDLAVRGSKERYQNQGETVTSSLIPLGKSSRFFHIHNTEGRRLL